MTTPALLRSGSLRVLVSPLLTLLFVMLSGFAYGHFQFPDLSRITGVSAFWTASAGFVLIELIWPCDKAGVEADHAPLARIAFAVIVALGLAGIGYGTLSMFALAF